MIPGPSRLLHIYDADALSIALTASARRNPRLPGLSLPTNIYPVPIHGGRHGLLIALDKLVKDGQSFSRALFETHGSSGSIYFGGESITGDTFRTFYNARGYDRLFSYLFCRIYFNGCSVADNPYGWDLLDAAGAVFLRLGGGAVFAQTEPGYPNFFNGHVYHFGSFTSYSVWAPGGMFLGHDVK